MTRAMYETVGGRRFLLTVGTQVLSSLLLWYGKLTPDAYSMLILGTVGVYIGSSTYEKTKVQKDA